MLSGRHAGQRIRGSVYIFVFVLPASSCTPVFIVTRQTFLASIFWGADKNGGLLSDEQRSDTKISSIWRVGFDSEPNIETGILS